SWAGMLPGGSWSVESSALPTAPAFLLRFAIRLGVFGLVVSEMAAGQGDKDVLQAHLSGRQPCEGTMLGLQVIQERRDGAMGLAHGQAITVCFGPARENRLQAGEFGGIGRLDPFQKCELDNVFAANSCDQLLGRPESDDLAPVDDGNAVTELFG